MSPSKQVFLPVRTIALLTHAPRDVPALNHAYIRMNREYVSFRCSLGFFRIVSHIIRRFDRRIDGDFDFLRSVSPGFINEADQPFDKEPGRNDKENKTVKTDRGARRGRSVGTEEITTPMTTARIMK